MSKHIEEIAYVIRDDPNCLNGCGLNVKQLSAAYKRNDMNYIINKLKEIKMDMSITLDIFYPELMKIVLCKN